MYIIMSSFFQLITVDIILICAISNEIDSNNTNVKPEGQRDIYIHIANRGSKLLIASK